MLRTLYTPIAISILLHPDTWLRRPYITHPINTCKYLSLRIKAYHYPSILTVQFLITPIVPSSFFLFDIQPIWLLSHIFTIAFQCVGVIYGSMRNIIKSSALLYEQAILSGVKTLATPSIGHKLLISKLIPLLSCLTFVCTWISRWLQKPCEIARIRIEGISIERCQIYKGIWKLITILWTSGFLYNESEDAAF